MKSPNFESESILFSDWNNIPKGKLMQIILDPYRQIDPKNMQEITSTRNWHFFLVEEDDRKSFYNSLRKIEEIKRTRHFTAFLIQSTTFSEMYNFIGQISIISQISPVQILNKKLPSGEKIFFSDQEIIDLEIAVDPIDNDLKSFLEQFSPDSNFVNKHLGFFYSVFAPRRQRDFLLKSIKEFNIEAPFINNIDFYLLLITGFEVNFLEQTEGYSYQLRDKYISHFTRVLSLIKDNITLKSVLRFLNECSKEIANSRLDIFLKTEIIKVITSEGPFNTDIARFSIANKLSLDKESIKPVELILKTSSLVRSKEFLSNFFKELIIALENVWEEFESDLFNKIDSIESFSDIVANSQGLLKSEFEFLIKNYLRLIIEGTSKGKFELESKGLPALFPIIQGKFSAHSKESYYNKFCDYCKNILDLLTQLKSLEKLSEFNRLEQWISLYENEIIPTIPRLETVKDITNDFFEFEKGIENLIEFFVKKELELLRKYEEWLLREFPSILQSNPEKTVLNAVKIVKNLYSRGYKPLLLIIDGIDLGTYKKFDEILLRNGFRRISGDIKGLTSRRVLSCLPSSTTYSRRSIFAGTTYNGIVSLKENGAISNINDEKGLLAYACSISKGSIAYENTPDSLEALCKKLIAEEIKIGAFVFRTGDAIEHKITEPSLIFREAMSSFFNYSVQQLAPLKDDPKARIVICADHGCIDVGSLQSFIRDHLLTGLVDANDDIHARYSILKKKTRNSNPIQPNLIKSINSNQLRDYGLPTTHKFKNSDHFEKINSLIFTRGKKTFPPRSTSKSRRITKSNSRLHHGGLSFYETVVPLEVYSPGVMFDVKYPIIESETDLYPSNTVFKYPISLKNPNEIGIEDIEITIQQLGYIPSFTLKEIAAQEKMKIVFDISPQEKGDKKIKIRIKYRILGEIKEFSKQLYIKIEPSREERLLKGRAVLYDW